jgi:mono/diheme cytochrome c family protein
MPQRPALETGAAILAAALAVGAVLVALDRGSLERRRKADEVWAATSGGDVDRGAAVTAAAGCGTCHVIPGISGAVGRVGPNLASLGTRAYVAGVLPNTPANLVRWLQDPRAIDPKTAMPALGLGDRDARDIAAYLYARTD